MQSAISTYQITRRVSGARGETETIVKDVTLTIGEGEFFVIVGPSGSGKSTLLRIMSGLERSYDGHVAYGNDRSARDASFVFQQFAIFPWLTVLENVELALIPRGVGERARRERAHRELERMGLAEAAHLYPRELSGGMRQRVGIARAFVAEPAIIFMDEPFSELDSFTAEELRQDLLRVWTERKPTIVMVTHIIAEALELGDRIAVLTPKPGRVEKIFENRLPRPREKRSKEFFALEDQIYAAVKP